MIRLVFGILTAAVSGVSFSSTEALSVLGDSVAGVPPAQMMKQYLNHKAEASFFARREVYEALNTVEDIHAYQDRLHAFFVERLGGFPERTPLHARVVAEIARDGYRIEKVIYESQPGLPVTATLYLPEADPPYPAVLVPCGHEAEGKAGETYQRAAILLAKNGIAALCYDPIGQGERYYFFDENRQPIHGTTVHHTLMGVGAILTGTNIAKYRIWDGMRGLDYLESRPEIDTTKLGCTGNSGGGTLTSYLMALDPRVACAAPSCYITSFPALFATIGPQDGEQNIFGQVAFGLDHADYLHMRAPRPTLICSATKDFFDIGGTWDSFRQAKRVFTRLGYSERVDIAEVDEGHGYHRPLREAMVRWMRRWLSGVDEVVVEEDFSILSAEELWSSPEGEVAWMEGTRSVFDLNLERAEGLRAQRETLWREASAEAARAKVQELTGVGGFQEQPAPASHGENTVDRNGYSVTTVVIEAEAGIALPALLMRPMADATGAVVFAGGNGFKEGAVEGGKLEGLVKEGKIVLAVELRGLGETYSNEYGNGPWALVGADWPDFFRAYLLGISMVGMRAEDVWSAARCLKQIIGPDMPISLMATEQATVPALHAAALAPDLFAHVTLENGLPSWEAVVATPHADKQLVNTVHNALAWYDLPDLVNALGADTVTQINAHVPEF